MESLLVYDQWCSAIIRRQDHLLLRRDHVTVVPDHRLNRPPAPALALARPEVKRAMVLRAYRLAVLRVGHHHVVTSLVVELERTRCFGAAQLELGQFRARFLAMTALHVTVNAVAGRAGVFTPPVAHPAVCNPNLARARAPLAVLRSVNARLNRARLRYSTMRARMTTHSRFNVVALASSRARTTRLGARRPGAPTAHDAVIGLRRGRGRQRRLEHPVAAAPHVYRVIDDGRRRGA